MTVRRKLVAVLLGSGLAVVLLAIGLRHFVATKGLSDITESALNEAKARWESNRISNYQLRVEVDGPMSGAYEVKVVSNKPESVTFKDAPLKNERTMSTWTVDGMFRLLDIDLVNQETATRNGNRIVVRAGFHETLGYPIRYQRHDYLSRTGFTWEVTRFDPSR